jgi:ABC-type antimicrobial peptide transport system permease subunit
MARHYFGDADPIGRRFTFDGQSTSYEIVGVAADAKYLDLHEPPPRTIYLNALQDARGSFHQFVLRTHVPPTAVAAEVRRIVRDALQTVALSKMTTLSDQVDASIVPERLVATLSELFGALGALLASVGLYGLLSYSIARRVGEIGIRMALGATARDVMGMVLKGALLLVGIGLLIGVPLALWSRQLAGAMVVNLQVRVAWPIAAAALAMVAVGLMAAYVPARRASRVQPMDALRHS